MAAKVIEDDEFEFLVTGLLIEVALRAKRRPRDECNIVATTGEELTGNQSVFLRAA